MNKFRSVILGGQSADRTNLVVGEKGGAAGVHNLISVAAPGETTRSPNQRDGDRHRLSRETASIKFKGATSEVDLINLSGGGAMVRAAVQPRLWDRIDLILGEGSALECAVRWLRDDRIGLEFAHETNIECDSRQRAALLLDVIRRSFPDIALATPGQAVAPTGESGPVAASTVSRRSSRRHPLIWIGELLWKHDSHKVRLRNISEAGVLIDNPTDLPESADVILRLGETGQLLAKVGWARGGQAGLVFASPFDVSTLAASKPQVAGSSWVRPAHLAPSPAAIDSSPWARQWQRASIAEMRAELEGFLKY